MSDIKFVYMYIMYGCMYILHVSVCLRDNIMKLNKLNEGLISYPYIIINCSCHLNKTNDRLTHDKLTYITVHVTFLARMVVRSYLGPPSRQSSNKNQNVMTRSGWMTNWLYMVYRVQLENPSPSPLLVKGAQFRFRAFEQVGIFIVHLLWHGAPIFVFSFEGTSRLVAS